MKKPTMIMLCMLLTAATVFAGKDTEQIEAALKSSDAAKLEELFKNGVDPNTKNTNGDSYVGTAAIWPEMLEKFVAAGADVNFAGKTDYTPLMTAATMSSPESVKMLIDAGANVNYAQKATGMTALHYATWRSNCARCVKYLLDAGANVNAQDKNGETPATVMVTAMSAKERANTVQYTTNYMKSIGYNNMPDRFTNPKPEDWDEPTEIMGLLLDANLDPDVKNKAGVNALMNAAYFNKVAIMDKLVKAGASLKDKDKQGKTVWAYAVDGGAGDAMAYMIQNGIAKVDEKIDWFDKHTGIDMKGMTALSVAAHNGSAERLKALLDMGADCMASSSGNFMTNGCLGVVKGKTPFVYAIESGDLEKVKVIVENCDKRKLWHSWPDYEIKPAAVSKAICNGPGIFDVFYKPWKYAEYMGYEDIVAYLKTEFDTFTVGKQSKG